MMRMLVLSSLAAALALTAAPAGAAQSHSAPRAHSASQRGDQATLLRARLASIYARIDMLRRRGAIGTEEAWVLRKQARRLELQLYGLSRRGAGDVKFGIDRLESRVGVAMDDARWGGRNRELDRSYGQRDSYERFDRYQSDRSGNYEHFDRYTGSSVDRWHDPFDRGNN
jgi:hypothetical protein